MRLNAELVEKAITVLSDWQTKYPQFPKEMKGDISSFGASIVQAGLLPSVLFFSEGKWKKETDTEGGKKKDTDSSTKERRANMIKMICEIMGNVPDEIDGLKIERPLLAHIRPDPNNADTLQKITEAALALKLAFRAFDIEKEKTKEP